MSTSKQLSAFVDTRSTSLVMLATAVWLAATAVAVFVMFLFRYALSGP